jgi:diguanylate cyclase (GGDEF)-like protein
MPGTEPLALLRRLRASPDGRKKYVIVVGTEEDEDALLNSLDSGADDYVTEPLRARDLDSRVRTGRRVNGLKNDVSRERHEVQRYLEEVAAANQRWEQAAFTDALTGLPNRRFAMEHLENEWVKSVHNGGRLSCLIIDVDHFKRVNDTHGHAVGDIVLQSVASVLRSSVRTEDVICRVGGEEFLVICRSDARTAAVVAERLRKAVASHHIVAGDFTGSVTVDALLKLADTAVYDAKKAGRDRISVSKG